MADLFAEADNASVIDQNKNYLNDLVGEGKKFKTPEELARGKAEADAFIEALKRENAELRQDVNSKSRLEEIAERLSALHKTEQTPSNQDNHTSDESRAQQNTGLTAEALEEMLNRKLSERETKRLQEQNLETVRNQLTQVFGNDYVASVKAKAAELGVTTDWMNQLAADNPKALLKLVGADAAPAPKRPDLFTPPPSALNSGNFVPSNTERTKSWYAALKTKDPVLYRDPKTQVQMHKDAQRLGERFFDS